jgi:hypothetical protein
MENLATKTRKRRNGKSVIPESRKREVSEDAIRRRAFELYLEYGDSSDETDNWYQAENELKYQFE